MIGRKVEKTDYRIRKRCQEDVSSLVVNIPDTCPTRKMTNVPTTGIMNEWKGLLRTGGRAANRRAFE